MKISLLKKNGLLFVALCMLFSLIACGVSDNDSSVDTDTSPSGDETGSVVKDEGFTTLSGSPGGFYISPARSDLTADKSIFNIDDVTITYHYGFDWYPDISEHLEYGQFYPYVDISFSYYRLEDDLTKEPGSRIVIPFKRVENIMTEEYRVSSIYDEDQELYFRKYNHSEKITVPMELFEADEGWISFNVYYESEEINEFYGYKNILTTSQTFYFVKLSDTTVKIYLSDRYVEE